MQALSARFCITYAGQVRMNVTFPVVICETLAILQPNIAWYINGKSVSESNNTDEWSFEITANSSTVDKLNAWHSASTGKLRFNESSASSTGATVNLSCLHNLATDGDNISSKSILRKYSVV